MDVKELYDSFLQQYKTPINLDKIEKGLTGPAFFNNHKDLFMMWKDTETNTYKIGLNDGTQLTAVGTAVETPPAAVPAAVADMPTRAIVPAEFRTSPTGAIPKTPSPKQQTKQQTSPEIEVVAVVAKVTEPEALLPRDPVVLRPIAADQAAPEKRKWIATDIRLQDPLLLKKMQVVTIETEEPDEPVKSANAENMDEPVKSANIKSTASVTRIVRY